MSCDLYRYACSTAKVYCNVNIDSLLATWKPSSLENIVVHSVTASGYAVTYIRTYVRNAIAFNLVLQ